MEKLIGKNLKKNIDISKKIFALTMATLILVSTLGINIERLYCLCKKEFTYSFFSNPTNCCAAADVCNKNTHRGCMQHSHQFFKLQLEVEKINSTAFELKKKGLDIDFALPNPSFSVFSEQSIAAKCVLAFPNPPPQYRVRSGREIGIFHQVFRC